MSVTLNTPISPSSLPKPAARFEAPRPQYLELKANVHRKLLNRLNLEALATTERSRAEAEIRTLLFELIAEESMPLSMAEREAILGDVLDEVFGLGPLEPLLRDPGVSDILVNTFSHVYVERAGKIERLPTTFQDDKHLMRVIDRIVSGVGRRVDDSSPMVDARLPDGSRVNAIIPPLAVDGPLLSIRRFPAERLKADDLVAIRSLTKPMLEFLEHCVRSKLNMLISGGTGAGKTTLLNVLSGFISERERIVTIEDAAELQLHQEHVARLETRPPNVEGKGAIRQRQLLINALRMRPDRIVVGETRGEEALDMLQAMNTGHDGSLTTVHANTPRDSLSRIETMIAMGATNLPERAMRQQIAAAIQIVIQQSRMADGTRKVTSISEITGMEGDVITMQEIFCFEKLGVTQDGKVIGRFRATGVRPKVCERLKASGVHLPADMFEGVTEVRVMVIVAVILAFLVGGGLVLAFAHYGAKVPEIMMRRQLDSRLNEVTVHDRPETETGTALLKSFNGGPLPTLERAFGQTARGNAISAWIAQSGTKASLSAVLLAALVLGIVLAIAAMMFMRTGLSMPVGFGIGFALPFVVLRTKRNRRLHAFEEQFPEALDLIGRALKAGHAFATGLKMVADEMDEPVGPEFRKTFDEQNFGLPLKDALENLTVRIPLLDVRFFSTAVLIQRETGGNLAEILDNLAHVVRERFKILRQVRVYTAHGRLTGYVLLALPAFLSIALMFINPEHMNLLFRERMGQMMLMGAAVMQMFGFVWIQKIVKIEV